MNRDNVVRFDDYARGRSARRGAADKLPFDEGERIEVECPSCSALLCLDVDLLSAHGEVFCAACDSPIAFQAEALEGRTR